MPDFPEGRIVLAGASGLLGQALAEAYRGRKTTVVRLVRRPPSSPDEVQWEPGERLDPRVVAGARAVVCLNGASIGRFPWTARYKEVLTESRLVPTRTLAHALGELGSDAPAFVASSGINYYGSATDGRVVESRASGRGFLANLCREWESAAEEAGPHARVAHLRTSPVVHREGVLKPLMLLTRAGLSGRIGTGRQVWPWISFTDAIRAIEHVIDRGVQGPINLVGPQRATANDFGFALARHMNRPYLVPAPVWAMKLALSEDAVNDLLLVNVDAAPDALEKSGFEFAHRTVEEAITDAVPR